MTRLLRFSLMSLMISPVLAASDNPATRWHISTPIDLTDGEHAEAIGITDGNIRLRGGSQAGSVRLNNGELKLDQGSRAGSVWIGVGEGRISGAVGGDVYCGTGTVTITSTAEIQGNVTSLGCVLDIAGGARIGGDVVTFGPEVRLGPDLTLSGRLAMLPGSGERKKRDMPTLDVRRGTVITGGVMLDHCVQIEVGRETAVQISGVVPHDPVAKNRPDHAPCSRFPGAQGVVDKASLPAPDDVFVHGAPETRPGSELGDVRLVNSGMELAHSAKAGTIRTHNGAVVLGVGAVAKSLDVLNGAVVLKPEARIEGPVSVGNGPLVLEQGSVVNGEVRVVTSSIQLGEGAAINGHVTQLGSAVELADGARIDTLRFALADDAERDSRAVLKMVSGASITGQLVLDRPVLIKLRQGPEPKWTGVEPEIRIRGR